MRLLFALLVLLSLLAGTGVAVVRRTPAALAVAGVLAVAWIFASGPLEGPVLLSLNEDHGVTASDLLSLAVLALVAWLARTLARVQA